MKETKALIDIWPCLMFGNKCFTASVVQQSVSEATGNEQAHSCAGACTVFARYRFMWLLSVLKKQKRIEPKTFSICRKGKSKIVEKWDTWWAAVSLVNFSSSPWIRQLSGDFVLKIFWPISTRDLLPANHFLRRLFNNWLEKI